MDHLPANTTVSTASTPYWKIILPYSLIYFFISLADAVMSYVSPIYIERHVDNPTLMGLIISSSSVVGIACDFIFARIFKRKFFSFFIWLAVICAAVFPLGFKLLPPGTPAFLLGMAVWGIYYELLQFSDFNFIKQSLGQRSYSAGWGTLNAFKSTAYFLGPLFTVSLVSNHNYSPAFSAAIGFTLIAALILVFYSLSLPKTGRPPPTEKPVPSPSSWMSQFKVWTTLIAKIWPVYIFIFILFLIDSAFWTIGTLFSEQLQSVSSFGGFLLPAYSLPTLFMGLVIGRIFPPTGKKRLSFITAAFAGLLLASVAVLSEPILIIAAVFSSSLLLSVSFPEMSAVFEDYVHRLDNFGDDMIGLQGSAVSLAYILGPIIAGILSALTNNQIAFAIFGLLLTVYSVLALIITPKKIRMPQQELQNSV